MLRFFSTSSERQTTTSYFSCLFFVLDITVLSSTACYSQVATHIGLSNGMLHACMRQDSVVTTRFWTIKCSLWRTSTNFWSISRRGTVLSVFYCSEEYTGRFLAITFDSEGDISDATFKKQEMNRKVLETPRFISANHNGSFQPIRLPYNYLSGSRVWHVFSFGTLVLVLSDRLRSLQPARWTVKMWKSWDKEIKVHFRLDKSVTITVILSYRLDCRIWPFHDSTRRSCVHCKAWVRIRKG